MGTRKTKRERTRQQERAEPDGLTAPLSTRLPHRDISVLRVHATIKGWTISKLATEILSSAARSLLEEDDQLHRDYVAALMQKRDLTPEQLKAAEERAADRYFEKTIRPQLETPEGYTPGQRKEARK